MSVIVAGLAAQEKEFPPNDSAGAAVPWDSRSEKWREMMGPALHKTAQFHIVEEDFCTVRPLRPGVRDTACPIRTG